jgi:hypothetical protein
MIKAPPLACGQSSGAPRTPRIADVRDKAACYRRLGDALPGTPLIGPCFKHGMVFPRRVRSIKGVIFSLGDFEKVKLYKALNGTTALWRAACDPADGARSKDWKAFPRGAN